MKKINKKLNLHYSIINQIVHFFGANMQAKEQKKRVKMGNGCREEWGMINDVSNDG